MKQALMIVPPTILLLVLPLFVSAQESCGSIIEIEDGIPYEEPIEDCDNPFGIPHPNPDLIVTFNDEEITAGGEYELLDELLTVKFLQYDSDFISGGLYIRDGEDFILTKELIGDENLYTFTQVGDYTLVIFEEEGADPTFIRELMPWFGNIIDHVVPIAYAFHGPAVVLNFSIAEVSDPEIDPLLLQYAPTLYMHPDENFFPVNVEAFIESSSLWDDNDLLPDELIKAESSSDPVTTDDVADPNSEDWYLSFSGGSESKFFNSALAKSKYDQLVASGDATTTYYAYKMEDSYTDDSGELHEFIVLQYWYFYVFNDWEDQGGFNNHEGDWESVFVFLDKETEDPQYVAFSAHHNDGDPDLDITQYDSVRRNWNSNEVVMDNSQIVSFVSLGSHANYPNNGNNGIHNARSADDLTSQHGEKVSPTGFNSVSFSDSEPLWLYQYKGKWGSDINDLFGEKSGPLSPSILDVSGILRFRSPIEWAGINNISEQTTTESTATLNFDEQNLFFLFSEEVPSGTTIAVDPHDEVITFGSNNDEVTLLPYFWDIESNLVNETFESDVSITYKEEDLVTWGIAEEDLTVYFYDEISGEWETVPTNVDTTANTATFTTTHFSRYALGEVVEQNLEDLYKELRVLVNESGLKRKERKILKGALRLSERSAEKEKSKLALLIIEIFKKKVDFLYKKEAIQTESYELILIFVEKIKEQIIKVG